MWKWIFYSLPPSLLWRPYFLITKLFSQALTYSSITGLPSDVPAHTPQADNLLWAIIFICLSCLTTYNGSLLPNTLGLNTFVAVVKDPTQLSHFFFFFSFWTLVFYLNTYWFQQIPHTYDMGTHLSILIHPPLSSSQSLLFLLQPKRYYHRWIPYSRGGQTFSIKSQIVNISASIVYVVCATTTQLFVTAWKGP